MKRQKPDNDNGSRMREVMARDEATLARGVANDNGRMSLDEKVDLLLAEQQLVREQLARLVAELRQRKHKTVRRTKSVRERSTDRLEAEYKPSEAQIARATRVLARQRR